MDPRPASIVFTDSEVKIVTTAQQLPHLASSFSIPLSSTMHIHIHQDTDASPPASDAADRDSIY